MRAQTTLPAVAVALVLLTVPVVLGVLIADGALESSERPAGERQTALAVSDRLVGPNAEITHRANVLEKSALSDLTESRLRTEYGVPENASITVVVDGERIVDGGGVGGATRIERIVRLATETERTLTVGGDTRNVTLPRRSEGATIEIDPQPGATVETVRANDRVVLRNESGLVGRFDVALSRYETTTLSFDVDGDLADESVTVTFRPRETYRSRLVVWLDG